MKKQFILFDFDGVIADTLAISFEIQKKICPDVTEEINRKRFEGNIYDWKDAANIHTDMCRHDIDFFSEYSSRLRKESLLVPGIKEVIEEFEKNYILIVVSSTLTPLIKEFLEIYNLGHYFAQIMGGDIHRSKTEKIKMIFEKYSISPKDCIFITDSLGDVLEAKKVNVKSIGVTWGVHPEETLLRGNPIKIIKNPSELFTAVLENTRKTR